MSLAQIERRRFKAEDIENALLSNLRRNEAKGIENRILNADNVPLTKKDKTLIASAIRFLINTDRNSDLRKGEFMGIEPSVLDSSFFTAIVDMTGVRRK